MTDFAVNADHLLELAGAVCNRTASKSDLAELKSLLLLDQTSCRHYLLYCEMHAALRFEVRADRAAQKVCQQFDIKSVPHASPESDVPEPLPSPFPTSPFPTFLSTTFPATIGYSSGWPVSYLTATAITGLLILGFWLMPVSHPEQVATHSLPPIAEQQLAPEPLPASVGRITGTVDCKRPGDSRVSVGQKFSLATGLMEITYNTGAKVILQGPVTYEVEANGGYLAVGKLTGKLEKKNDECRMMNDKLRAQMSDIHHSSFIIHPFSIRTPTATVTDLGTEFGVDVSEEGTTTSHVFLGSIRVQPLRADDRLENAGQIVCANESVRIAKSGKGDAERFTILKTSAGPVIFVRRLPSRTVRALDLVDVVAGGNGVSAIRNRGIDPTNGRICDAQPGIPYLQGDRKYHRVHRAPFVDGVFIPDGSKGPVQIDSAETVFDGFPATNNKCPGYIWAGGKVVLPGESTPKVTKLGGVEYASLGHGVLFMHANMGITFDLEAVRRANPGCQLLRFRAAAGNTEQVCETGPNVSSDFWVIVDGQRRYGQREINRYTGAFQVVVSIRQKDRFLTLASTDPHGDVYGAHIMFGDPRLELLINEPRNGQILQSN